MFTVAMLSQKGGVGKTLTCANLGAGLADLGHAVLMVDFDPQADLSSSWALDEDAARPRIEDSLEQPHADVGDALEHIALGDGAGSLALLPTGHERLRGQTARLLAGDGRELLCLLDPLDGRFDIALVDTPAGDTIFGRQAIVAADAAIVPLLPGYHELRALTRALGVLDERAEHAQTRLDLLGVLVLNADPRWRSTKEYTSHLAAMAANERLAMFDTVIPRHQPVTDHARYGLPTVWLRPASSVAVAYRELADEVTGRLAEIDVHRAAEDGNSSAARPAR